MKFPIKFNDYIIRPEKVSDAKGVKKLIDKLIDENADIGSNKKKTLKQWKKNISEKIKGKNAVLLVAIKDKKVIGGTNITLEKGKSSHVGEYGIGIIKEHRAKGIGSKLTRLIIQLAKEKLKGVELIELKVFKRNINAIKLYKKIGFKIVAKLHGTLKDKNEYFDEYIMHLWINK